MGLFVTHSINDNHQKQQSALSVIILNVVMLNVVAPGTSSRVKSRIKFYSTGPVMLHTYCASG
jgi:hypothetical protein